MQTIPSLLPTLYVIPPFQLPRHHLNQYYAVKIENHPFQGVRKWNFTYQDNSPTFTLPSHLKKNLQYTTRNLSGIPCSTATYWSEWAVSRCSGTGNDRGGEDLPCPGILFPLKQVHLTAVLQTLNSPSDNERTCVREHEPKELTDVCKGLSVFKRQHLFYLPPDTYLPVTAMMRST